MIKAQLDIFINKIITNYNIGKIISIEENTIGRQTNYILYSTSGKYFIKILDCQNKNIHKEDEIEVCNLLTQNKITVVTKYKKRYDGNYLTKLEDNIYFNIQNFVDGKIWKKYQAPNWLIFNCARFIGKVHNILKNTITLKQRESILEINNISQHLDKLDKIKNIILKSNLKEQKQFLLNDLKLREEILINQKNIELNKLTFVNGHSDFTITQIITNNHRLKGVIDFSEVANIPAIWEIMRFYINSSVECEYQHLDLNKFNKFINIYTKNIQLNEYDKKMMFIFNLYYYCQALSVYDKLIETNFSEPYMQRIISRNNTIQCLKNNINCIL